MWVVAVVGDSHVKAFPTYYKLIKKKKKRKHPKPAQLPKTKHITTHTMISIYTFIVLVTFFCILLTILLFGSLPEFR